MHFESLTFNGSYIYSYSGFSIFEKKKTVSALVNDGLKATTINHHFPSSYLIPIIWYSCAVCMTSAQQWNQFFGINSWRNHTHIVYYPMYFINRSWDGHLYIHIPQPRWFVNSLKMKILHRISHLIQNKTIKKHKRNEYFFFIVTIEKRSILFCTMCIYIIFTIKKNNTRKKDFNTVPYQH